MSKLINALQMLDLLSVRSVISLQELSNSLEISIRAVQRLKDTLIDAGYDIQTVMGPQGGYKLQSRAKISALDFSHEEIRDIKQGLAHLVQSQGSLFSNTFSLSIAKLSNQLEDYSTQTVMSFQSVKMNVDPQVYYKHIRTLEACIKSQIKVKIEYQKNQSTLNTYEFQPYELMIVNQFWYVVGYDQKGRYISLKVNRIKHMESMDTTFLKDTGPKPSLGVGSFGYKIKPIKVKCFVESADYISEYIWGNDQQIQWVSDHQFMLDVEFQNIHSAQDFVLRNGKNIKVLQPQSLIDWLIKETQAILRKYPCNSID